MNPDLPPRLASPEDIAPSPDFQEAVMSRVHRRKQRFHQARLATTLCLLAGSSMFLGRQLNRWRTRIGSPPSARVVSAARGVNWLLSEQRADGSWSAASTGGHERFSPGVTALATLALLKAPDPVPETAVDNALARVESSVAEGSLFALDGPEFYNRILELQVLVEAERMRPAPPRRALLRDTLADVVAAQAPRGGWGYTSDSAFGYQSSTTPNSAVTWWVAQLLRQADFLRIPGTPEALDRADAWLAARFSNPLRPEYRPGMQLESGPEQALGWMALAFHNAAFDGGPDALVVQDAYRDYLRSRIDQTEALLESLREHQREDGSWRNAEDRWWRAGGQVYLTAMSVLAQVPKGA